MKQKIILFVLLIISINFIPVKADDLPDIKLAADIIKTSAPSSYMLNYNITFQKIDPEAYLNYEISYPDEFFITEGTVKNGIISEKDFLSSEQDLDLNGDGDTSDTFNLSIKAGSFVISGKQITPIYKKINSSLLLIPVDSSRIENLVKLSSSGTAFTIHNINIHTGKITAGTAKKGNNVAFKKYPNSLLIIEIIRDMNNSPKSGVKINNINAAEGLTNEKIVSVSGEPVFRYSYLTNVNINSGKAAGSLKIDQLTEPFIVRVKYCFAVTDRIIIVSEKLIFQGKHY